MYHTLLTAGVIQIRTMMTSLSLLIHPHYLIAVLVMISVHYRVVASTNGKIMITELSADELVYSRVACGCC